MIAKKKPNFLTVLLLNSHTFEPLLLVEIAIHQAVFYCGRSLAALNIKQGAKGIQDFERGHFKIYKLGTKVLHYDTSVPSSTKESHIHDLEVWRVDHTALCHFSFLASFVFAHCHFCVYFSGRRRLET